MNGNDAAYIRNFLATWNDESGMKELCEILHAHMASLAGAALSFVSRPGVSHSIRLTGGTGDILALLDVIDDDPAGRWLSLCFPDGWSRTRRMWEMSSRKG